MRDREKPRLQLLGRPVMTFSGGTVPLPEKSWIMLAALIAAPSARLERDYLRRMLWHSADPVKRAGNLRQLLARIQKEIIPFAPFLVIDADSVSLNAAECEMDILRLRGSAPLPETAWDLLYCELLDGADLSTGEADEILRELRDQLADWRIRHIEMLLEPETLNDEAVQRLATRLVELDPSNETGWQQLIVAHAQQGDLSAARQAYLRCKAQLKSVLGSAPGTRTEQLALELGIVTRAPAFAGQLDIAGLQPPVRALATHQPRVVLLPPETFASDPLLDRLGRVLLEDVTIALSNQKQFKIIAAHTSLELVQHAHNPMQLATSVRALDFDYSVYMTIVSEGGEFHATCRLAKVETGEVLWAMELPLRMDQMTTSFHRLGRRISTSLSSAIERHELASPIDNPNPTAFRLYLEGKRHLAGTDLKLLRHARKWFRASIQALDDYAPSHIGMARTLSLEYLVRLMKDKELLDQAERSAAAALERDPSNGRALREFGYIALYRRRHAQSLGFYQQARETNPHDADLLADYADALCHDGRLDEAHDTIREALSLNPLPSDHYHWYLGGIHFMKDELDQALEALEIISAKPAVARLLAAVHAARGDIKSARHFAGIVLEHFPDFRTEQLWHFMPDRRPEDTRKLIANLNAAGLQ